MAISVNKLKQIIEAYDNFDNDNFEISRNSD